MEQIISRLVKDEKKELSLLFGCCARYEMARVMFLVPFL